MEQNIKTATSKDVHAEFDKVSNKLLKEATRIVAEENNNASALRKRMRDLGFSNSISIKYKEKIIETSQKILSLNVLHYPQHNFFTEDSISAICKKYGLLLAKPIDYIGEIPLKNQREIANFKLAEDHQQVRVIDRKKFFDNIQEMKKLKKKVNKFDSKNSFHQMITMAFEIMDAFKLSRLKGEYTRKVSKNKFLSNNDPNLSFRSEVKPEFVIVATPDKFNLENKKVVGEYMLVDEDPVVLCKIEGLYCQVSAWGGEAEMNEFTTPTKN